MKFFLIASFTILYFVVGGFFSYLRWRMYVNSECDFYEQERKRFLQLNGFTTDEMPEYMRYEWRNIVASNFRLKTIPPKHSDHRGEIIFDFLFWSVSVLFLLVVKAYETSLHTFETVFGRVTDIKAQRINKDLKG